MTDAPAIRNEAPQFLDGLNPEQRDAVIATEGPVLVLAGAGTGKTRVLTTRIAYILSQRLAAPWEILSVTFTNKAAREMQERVALLTGRPVENMPWLGTFHAMGAKILRQHAELVGLKSNFTIIDTDDQIRVLKQLIEMANIDEKRWPARFLATLIDKWKNQGLVPEKVPSQEAHVFADGKGIALYAAYQARLKALNAADFGDLLVHCLTLFMGHPDVLKQFQNRFKYILVDEYQDSNVAQYLWLRLLAQGDHNICCVGDDDQSIYGWRGAEVGNILRFEQDFPGAKVVRLERNYRSTQNILGAASGLIAANESRLGKTLWTDQEGEGDKVVVRGVWDGRAEAQLIGDDIEAAQVAGQSLNDVAVLVRATFQTREFEERFLELGLPYQIIGGLRFYERAECRDAIAYLRLIAQPDDDLAFERIINKPKRGLGEATIQKLHILARAEDIPLMRAARLLSETDELRPQARKALSAFLENISRWQADLEEMHHAELTRTVLDESGYTDALQNDKSVQAPARLDNLREFVRGMEDFEGMTEFLEHVSLVAENEQAATDERISVMTLHGAKGLEFKTVFLPGWEEELFPHRLSLEEGGAAGLEEERRLAYVGLTRAREKAVISFAATRRMYDRWLSPAPSRFIEELPKEHIEIVHQDGFQSGGLPYLEGDADRPGRGPGWRRIQARGLARNRDTGSGRSSVGETEVTSFNPGDRIFHEKFGYGVIQEISGNKLKIAFEKAGTKMVIDSFVSAA